MTEYINSIIFVSSVLLAMIKNTLFMIIRTLSNLIAVEARYLWLVILDRVCHLYFVELSFARLFGGYYGLSNTHTNTILPKCLELYFYLI